jgi:hypothetical protein
LDPALFAGVLAGARGDPAQLPELELCGSLADKRLLELDPETTQRLADHRWLQDFERRLGPTSMPYEEDYLLRISSAVLNAHAQPLAHGLRAVHDPMRANRLLHMLPEPVIVAYLWSFHGYQHRPLGPAEVALIVTANDLLAGLADRSKQSSDRDSSSQVRWDLSVVVEEWCRNSSRKKIRQVTRHLDSFGGGLAESWEVYAEDIHRPRLWHGRTEPGS